MPFALQALRALMDAHPDRAAPLRIHVEALESIIATDPPRCLERVRALFESTYATIAPQLGVTFDPRDEFPTKNSKIIRALNFTLDGHPEGEKVDESIRKLIGSINGTIGALSELSNIAGLRHGGSLDWATLQRQHALMLGGLCDTLIGFLFEIAWSRATAEAASDKERYETHVTFNASLDDEYGDVTVAGSTFPASLVLFRLDEIQYDTARAEWEAEQAFLANQASPA